MVVNLNGRGFGSGGLWCDRTTDDACLMEAEGAAMVAMEAAAAAAEM